MKKTQRKIDRVQVLLAQIVNETSYEDMLDIVQKQCLEIYKHRFQKYYGIDDSDTDYCLSENQGDNKQFSNVMIHHILKNHYDYIA